MRRRDFLKVIVGLVPCRPLSARAGPERQRHIVMLISTDRAAFAARPC